MNKDILLVDLVATKAVYGISKKPRLFNKKLGVINPSELSSKLVEFQTKAREALREAKVGKCSFELHSYPGIENDDGERQMSLTSKVIFSGEYPR